MKKTHLPMSVDKATERLRTSLTAKGFDIFADIDHRQNAQAVDLDLPDARVLIFGNPMAGTKLMQKDLFIAFDLPLRLAVVDDGGVTLLLFQESADYDNRYRVQGHPVLEKIDQLFSALVEELSGQTGDDGRE